MKDIEIISYDPSNSRTVKKTDSVVDSIIDKFIDRATYGKQKYGVDLDREDISLEEWIEHSLEEHMDAILYLQKIKKVISGKNKL
tara:strand:- start:578 stop:832 length:255 start_codon:yes stop_codon:yes gene_type:complete